MFFTQLCIMAIQIFEISKTKRKNAYSFLIKKDLYTAQKAQNRKTFSKYQASYQKNLCLLSEKSGTFFHRANV